MFRQQDLNAHSSGTSYDCVEIVDLEPQQHSVSVWPIVRITHRAVMMFRFEAVQLKNKSAIRNELFVLGTSMIATTAKETLIPFTACSHVVNGD